MSHMHARSNHNPYIFLYLAKISWHSFDTSWIHRRIAWCYWNTSSVASSGGGEERCTSCSLAWIWAYSAVIRRQTNLETVWPIFDFKLFIINRRTHIYNLNRHKNARKIYIYVPNISKDENVVMWFKEYNMSLLYARHLMDALWHGKVCPSGTMSGWISG